MKKMKFILLGLATVVLVVGLLIHYNPKPAIRIHHLFSIEEPPYWLQRLNQRQDVRAKVQSAGGWNALRSDCSHLWQTNRDNPFYYWHRGMTNQTALPLAIATLQPMSVEVTPEGIVSIDLYGMGESRHRGIANYALEVYCGQPMNPEEPKLKSGFATYHKIANNIYEAY
jgi:hypothetical protein